MKPEQNPSKLVRALEYLKDHGLSIDHLCDLHHNPKRTERFSAAITYRLKPQEYREPNITYHHRLLFVASEHWRTEADFDALVSQVCDRFPYPDT